MSDRKGSGCPQALGSGRRSSPGPDRTKRREPSGFHDRLKGVNATCRKPILLRAVIHGPSSAPNIRRPSLGGVLDVLLPTPPTAPESAYRVVEPLQNAAPERRVPPSWPERISAPRAWSRA